MPPICRLSRLDEGDHAFDCLPLQGGQYRAVMPERDGDASLCLRGPTCPQSSGLYHDVASNEVFEGVIGEECGHQHEDDARTQLSGMDHEDSWMSSRRIAAEVGEASIKGEQDSTLRSSSLSQTAVG